MMMKKRIRGGGGGGGGGGEEEEEEEEEEAEEKKKKKKTCLAVAVQWVDAPVLQGGMECAWAHTAGNSPLILFQLTAAPGVAGLFGLVLTRLIPKECVQIG